MKSISFTVAIVFAIGLFPFSRGVGQVAQSDTWGVIGINSNSAKLAEECRDGLNRLAKNVRELKDAKPLDVGKANALCNRLIWNSETLLQYGEPCGVEYYVRGQQLSNRIQQVARSKATRFQPQARAYMNQQSKKRNAAIKRLYKLLSSKDYVAAEKVYFNVQGDIDLYVLYLRDRDRQVLVQSLLSIYRVLPASLKKMRSEETKKKLNALIKERTVDVAAVTQQAKSLVDNIRSRKDDGTTPDSLKKVVELWRSAHARIQKRTAYDALYKSVELDLSNLENWTTVSSYKGDSDAQKLQDSIVPILTSTIETDLMLAHPSVVRKKYLGYVALVADLKNNMDEKLRTQLVDAIQLIHKEPGDFSNTVSKYREATNDLLYWREKFAKDSRHPGAKVIRKLPRAITGSNTTFSVNTQQLLPNLKLGLNEVLPGLRKSVVERTVKVFGLSVIGNRSPVSHLDQQCWAVVRNNDSIKNQIRSLRRDLMAEDEPALSFVASESIRTAERAQWDEVGGEISALRVASLATSISKLKTENSHNYLPLGKALEPIAINSSLIQSEIQPIWIRHKHFHWIQNK